MFFDLDWQKLLKKKQKEYEEQLARLHAILKIEEGMREHLKELAAVIRELEEKQKIERKKALEDQKIKDIRVLRELAEGRITGSSGKANWVRTKLAERRIKKVEKALALAEQREQAEKDVVVDSVTWEPTLPDRQARLKVEPGAFAPVPGMKSRH